MTKDKKTVLIIEDTITYQQALKREFLKNDFDVLCANNGEEGLHSIKKSLPHLIILDLLMPGIDGRAVCREIKTNIHYRHIPVMMLTMLKEEKDIEASLDSGADSYVHKDESLDLVVQRAEALLNLSVAVKPILEEQGDVIREEELELKDKKILLVDDDLAYLKLLEKHLISAGYHVATVISGQECLEYLKKETVDIVILDLKMPEVDGTDVCRQLRKIKKFHDLPIVILTGSGSPDDSVRSFKSGANDCLTKADDFRIIKLRIYSILRRRHFEKETERILAKERETIGRLNKEVAERKKGEEKIKQMFKALEKANKELKESTAQLIQSAKLTALGELTAGIAHELNQPINVTKIICQSILKDIERGNFDKQDAQQDLPEIVTQMNKMAEIIDHMRIFTRQTDEMESKTIDLNMIVNESFKFLGQQLKDHNIEVIYELDQKLPKVIGDPTRLEQVFMNLISNAKDALEDSQREDKKLEIRTYKRNDRQVVVEVKDNGLGISKVHKDKVLHPFFSTKEPGKGTGLGLSVSNKIIEEHQGEIEIESKFGEGAVFKVVLPAVE